LFRTKSASAQIKTIRSPDETESIPESRPRPKDILNPDEVASVPIDVMNPEEEKEEEE
jgi:hypothetical protein